MVIIKKYLRAMRDNMSGLGDVIKRVKCIETDPRSLFGNGIQNGKIYDVTGVIEPTLYVRGYYTLARDDGRLTSVYQHRFVDIDDPDTDYDENDYRESDI